VDKNGTPVKVKITAGNINDSTEFENLVSGIKTKKLIADKGFDTNAIIKYAKANNIEPVIPPKSNRKEQREYDKELYKKRHIVENVFLWLKRWRGIAIRYAKNTASFLAAVQIRCISLFLNKTRADTI